MKKLCTAVAAFLCIFSVSAFAQFDQGLFTEFSQKFQQANQARMAGKYDEALKLFEACLDEKYSSQPALADMMPGVHTLLGMLYGMYMNKEDDARLQYEKAVEILSAAPMIDDPSMAQMNAIKQSQIATNYRLMGDYEKMLQPLQKTIEYYEQYWNTPADYKMQESDYARMVAPNYYFLGLAYKNLGDGANAKANLEKAADMYGKLLGGQYASDVYVMLSYIHRELGDPAKCIDYYRKYLDARSAELNGDKTGLLMLDISRIALGQYLTDAEQWDSAIAELDKTIAAGKALDWTSDLWRAWSLKGKALEKKGDKDAALKAYEEAIKVIESQRSGLSAGDDRAAFLEKHIAVYRDIIRLLIEMGRPEDALQYLERSKARSFLDMMGGRTVGKLSAQEKDVVEKQLALQKEINGLTMQLTGGGGGMRGVSGADAETGVGKLREVRLRYAELMTKVKEMNPEFTSLVTVNPPDVADVRAALGPSVKIVEFFPDDDALYIWVIGADSAEMRRADSGSKAVENLVKTLRSKITRGTIDDSYKKQAGKLYEILIAPIEDLVTGASNLIIVPHGALHYLPFNVLLKGDEFLIDRFTVTISPSAGAIKYILDKKNPENGRLFALGDPATTLPGLPAALDEVNAIKADFKTSAVFTREKAVEKLLSEGDAEKADVVHIASHGLFYADKPMLSALALSPDPSTGADGFLQVHEIFGLSLPEANLVTLSACETGLSAISAGDELVGLSRAFIYAGAPRVIVSLWTVSDASTGEMMKMMYKSGSAEGAASALRDAQLKLKSNPEFNHPFFWAPFQLIGDWR